MDPQLTRRVLTGDDGAPLDSDCVLAIATRWGDVALSLTHLKPGVALTPTEGVGVRWENGLPVISTSGSVRSFLARGGLAPAESGRLTALELGDVFLATSGAITLEARLQRRSELAGAVPRRDTRRLALVMTHSMMFAAAVLAVLVLTPFVPDDNAFGHPIHFRIPVTPLASVPRVSAQKEIQEKIQQVAVSAFPVVKKAMRRTAEDVLKTLFDGGGGTRSVVGGGNFDSIDTALKAMGSGNGQANADVNGIGARDTGGGGGTLGGLGIGGVGTRVGSGGPGPGFGLSGNAKKREEVICANCTPKFPPGYDRDLVLKVVRMHQNEIRYCYESELPKHPELAGKITVAWTISGSGAVDSAEVAESGLNNTNVEACIVQRIRRWRFAEPKGGEEVAITFPWVFQVAGSE